MRALFLILLILITVVRGFLANPVTKRCRSMNISFARKKTCGEKEGGKLKTTTNNDYGEYSSNISLNL